MEAKAATSRQKLQRFQRGRDFAKYKTDKSGLGIRLLLFEYVPKSEVVELLADK